nr:MAG TPA: CRISPR-associated exonuclease [Caudoviricetes sp.]
MLQYNQPRPICSVRSCWKTPYKGKCPRRRTCIRHLYHLKEES